MSVGTSTSCSASCGAQRTVRAARGGQTKLGHFDNLLRNRTRSGRRPPAVPPSAAQENPEFEPWTRHRQAAPWCASRPVPAAPAAHPDRVAGNPGEEGASVAVAPRTCPCAPPPRPCPSSVLLRSGAYTRTGPSRRSAARASATSEGVFPSDGGPRPHRRRVQQPSPPAASDNAATVRLWAEATSLGKMSTVGGGGGGSDR